MTGDAAIYFNTKDKLSILDSIQQVIYKKDLRKQLLNKGYQRIKQFAWEKTAHQIKKLYEGIL